MCLAPSHRSVPPPGVRTQCPRKSSVDGWTAIRRIDNREADNVWRASRPLSPRRIPSRNRPRSSRRTPGRSAIAWRFPRTPRRRRQIVAARFRRSPTRLPWRELIPVSWRLGPMEAHPAQVQAAVQQLLMEYGEYVPLELLLATNRLGYEDYRAWREGRLETLDAVLADGTRASCAWLEAAQSWACEPRSDRRVGGASWLGEHRRNRPGSASADPRLNALLSTRFHRAQEPRFSSTSSLTAHKPRRSTRWSTH